MAASPGRAGCSDHAPVRRRRRLNQRCGDSALPDRDPLRRSFHVVAWATEELDAARRRAWNDALAPKAAAERATRPAEGRRLLPSQPSRPHSPTGENAMGAAKMSAIGFNMSSSWRGAL
jgi:hypothetical protein